jgi:hypothetical protein
MAHRQARRERSRATTTPERRDAIEFSNTILEVIARKAAANLNHHSRGDNTPTPATKCPPGAFGCGQKTPRRSTAREASSGLRISPASLVGRTATRFPSVVLWRVFRRIAVSVLLGFPTRIRCPAGSVGDRSLRRSLTWHANLRSERDVRELYS